jgi:hypothetical protein
MLRSSCEAPTSRIPAVPGHSEIDLFMDRHTDRAVSHEKWCTKNFHAARDFVFALVLMAVLATCCSHRHCGTQGASES